MSLRLREKEGRDFDRMACLSYSKVLCRGCCHSHPCRLAFCLAYPFIQLKILLDIEVSVTASDFVTEVEGTEKMSHGDLTSEALSDPLL
jgi:hypothetical protein